jgi:hypothetical protein
VIVELPDDYMNTAELRALLNALLEEGTIRFGAYDWRVLDVQDGKALLLTDKVIEKRSFHAEYILNSVNFVPLQIQQTNIIGNSFRLKA